MNHQHSMTDEKLIQFYLNGDPHAMATLVELYKDRVYRSIYNIVQDKAVAEEIFQDVFICLINNMIAGTIADNVDFLQSASRIARNLCMEQARKTKLPIFRVEQSDEAVPCAVPALLTSSNYHENHGKIKSLIDLLPDSQREVLVLSHYSGLTFKEIADIMKCTLNTVLNNMKFGLTNLRKMMIEKEIGLSYLGRL